jgi:hypothetical protein
MNHDEPTTINAEMTIRRVDLTDAGREAVARLAELDSRDDLDRPVLGIEVEGTLLAAVSLATGKVISDPFSRTAELRNLLEVRAGQLRRRGSKRRRGERARRRNGRPAVGGSPPGSILSLPRWG